MRKPCLWICNGGKRVSLFTYASGDAWRAYLKIGLREDNKNVVGWLYLVLVELRALSLYPYFSVVWKRYLDSLEIVFVSPALGLLMENA